MKLSNYLYLFGMLAVMLSGCASSKSEIMPIWTQTYTPMPTSTSIPSRFTPKPQPTQTPTLTHPATLAAEQAQIALETLLKEPVDCSAPCFWGITPGRTMLSDAKEILTHLGLEINNTTQANKEFYGTSYKFDNGLSISAILTIQDTIIENIRLKIIPEVRQSRVPRKWLAYSPETLINRYGPPSRADFAIAWGPGTSSYFQMVMYFDNVDLIAEYDGQDIIPWQQKSSPQVCPSVDQFEIVRIWMGKNPVYPPASAVSLESATGMTMEEFSKLMTGDPNKACFNLKGEMFP